jgi:hypothetical protein
LRVHAGHIVEEQLAIFLGATSHPLAANQDVVIGRGRYTDAACDLLLAHALSKRRRFGHFWRSSGSGGSVHAMQRPDETSNERLSLALLAERAGCDWQLQHTLMDAGGATLERADAEVVVA